MKKMGNWRFFKFKIKKKPIWCEMAQIGQRQIDIKIISVHNFRLVDQRHILDILG